MQGGRPIDRGLGDPEGKEAHGHLWALQTAQGSADDRVGGEAAALDVVGNKRQIGGKAIGEGNDFTHDLHCRVGAHVGDISGDIVDIGA